MPSPPSRRQRQSDFTGLQILVLFGILGLAAAIPVITHQVPPIEDYINHLARMKVIAAGDSDPDLARFYEIDWQIVPNLMMDFLVPPLARIVNVYVAGQIFLVFTMLLILSGTLALNRALFKHWSVLPLIAFPLLYNYVFLVGVMNYMFGIGLTLWGLAVWIWLRERPWPARLLASTAFLMVIFFCHLFAVGLYGVGLLAIELERLWAQRKQPLLPRLIDFFASGIPFLPLIPLLLASPTIGFWYDFYWEQRGKIDGLMMIIAVYSDIVAFALTAVVVAAAVWAIRHNLLRIHPIGYAILGVGAAVYLALPRMLFATYMADQRLPIALAFMFIGCVHLELRHQLVRRGFLALIFVVLVVRVIEVDLNWTSLSQETLSFRESTKRIVRGSTVLIAHADTAAGDDVKDLGLVHAGCLAMIERSALVTRAFTVRGKQIMHVRPEYISRVDNEDGEAPSLNELLLVLDGRKDASERYWRDWADRYDYVYVLFTDDEMENPAPKRLTQVYEGGRFKLFRINKGTAQITPAVRAN
jgi:hypothetical protein